MTAVKQAAYSKAADPATSNDLSPRRVLDNGMTHVMAPGYRQKATGQKATKQKATDKRPQDRRPLRQKATGQKTTEHNVKMLLSCQDVLERLRVVSKTVEQIVVYVSSVLVCRLSLFVVYLSYVLVNCSTSATVCIGQVSPC